MKDDFTPKIVNFVVWLIGLLAARLGLVLVDADELARLRAVPEPRPTPPGTKLIPASFIGIDPLMVQRVGGDAAILLETVTFWLAANARQGRDDTYNSYPAWAETLRQRTGIEWDKSKIGRLMRSLKEADVLAGRQAAPHKPTTYRKGDALKARDADLHRVGSVVQLPLALPQAPGAKADDIHTIQTPQINSLTSSNPMPKAAEADAPATVGAAAAPVVNHLSDILDSREARDKRAGHLQDADRERYVRKAGPSPVPAAPSPRPDELPTEPDAVEDAPVSSTLLTVFGLADARELAQRYGVARVEAMIEDTALRPNVDNLAGLVRFRLAKGDPTSAERVRKATGSVYIDGRWEKVFS